MGERLHCVDLGHDLLVSSLLGETLKQLHLGISLKLHSLSDHWGDVLLGLGNSSSSVGISLGDGLCRIGLGLLNVLSLDELGLGNYLVVLEISLSIDLIDEGCGLGFPLGLDSGGLGLDLLNFLSFLHLFKRSLLILILSLLFFDLLGFDFLLSIVLDSLVVGESLSLQCVLELENSLLLHGVGNLTVEHHIGDDATLHDDSFIV